MSPHVNNHDNLSSRKNPNKRLSGHVRKILNDSATVFITNFPEDYDAKALWRAFQHWGNVREVFIPQKRDRRGKRFGFARFVGVQDLPKLVKQLDNIYFGDLKMHANVPKFSRQPAEKSPHVQVHNKGKYVAKESPYQSRTERGVSYAQVVTKGIQENKSPAPPHPGHLDKQNEDSPKEFFHLQHNVDDEVLQKCRLAYVGKVKDLIDVFNIQQKFNMEGYFSVKATPLGSKLVLLEADDPEELPHLVSDAEDWLSTWFTEIRPWDPRDVAAERMVWLKCYGVPVHAWSESFFRLLTSAKGHFINLDECTRLRRRLDVGRVLIRTSLHYSINSTIRVNIDGLVFNIRLLEEVFGNNILHLPPVQESDSSSEDSEMLPLEDYSGVDLNFGIDENVFNNFTSTEVAHNIEPNQSLGLQTTLSGHSKDQNPLVTCCATPQHNSDTELQSTAAPPSTNSPSPSQLLATIPACNKKVRSLSSLLDPALATNQTSSPNFERLSSERSSSASSINDSDIRRCNSRIFARFGGSFAEKVWESCKALGVTFEGDERSIIKMLEEMEIRDNSILPTAGDTSKIQ